MYFLNQVREEVLNVLEKIFDASKPTFVILTYCQLPCWNTILLSHFHTTSFYTTILTYYHTTTLQYCHTVILSYCHTVKLPQCHTDILSYCHTGKRNFTYYTSPAVASVWFAFTLESDDCSPAFKSVIF